MFDRPSHGDVRRRIAVRFAAVVAVFAAAAGIHSAANAQQATMAIFAPPPSPVIITRAGADNSVVTSGNVSTILDRIETFHPGASNSPQYMQLVVNGSGVGPAGPRTANGLPTYFNGELTAGSTVALQNNLVGGTAIFEAFVYGDHPNLSLAISASTGTVDDLAAADEFFIDRVSFASTTTPATGNIGFVGVECDAADDLFADTDRLICELICPTGEVENTDATMCMDPLTDADCEAMMSGTEPNEDRNECIFTANSCSGIGGVINSGNDGCDFTDQSCGDAMVGATANSGGTACTFTDESCNAAVEGMVANNDNTGCLFTDESCQTLIVGSVENNDRCECPAGENRLDDIDGVDYCVNFEPPAENSAIANSLYTSANCENENAGNWAVAYEFDSSAPAQIVAELCAIPYQVDNPPASAGGDNVPLQVNPGDSGDNCVMRINSGATAAVTAERCGDEGLFANGGFPVKPNGFDASTGSTDRLMINPDTREISFGGDIITDFVAPETSESGGGGGSTTVAASAPASKNSGQHALGVGLGLGVLVYLYSWHYYDGDIGGLFNFSPDYGYSVTEGGYSYRYGGRLDFRNDDLHLYWSAGQANSNGDFGDFRYESGGEYTADFWTASFSEVVRSEESDYDFSLSADYKGGIWRLSPTYRLRHSRYAEAESETANSLNLEGVLRYNRWTISPSAGFNWESADEFGDNARFNLSAVRRF
ncbi:MAG: hypothetical protein ACR2QC_00575 [Gammaproteobacteria bacterium]